ncbi:MAG TPA: SRPBCC family protein [Candidatus Limnocylindrales bacterium]|nr:SRPBCC family protein [Candidatus Limnocylindrales bacterium]
MIEPIHLVVELDCPAEHAFEVWTARIGTWWPLDHTATGQPGLAVILEGRPGGRIFERTPAGAEHDWDEVLAWEPPARLVYSWHLRRDRADATEVEIRFVPLERSRTRVEIEHRAWERLGAEGESWRDRNRGGWSTLLPHYRTAAESAG